MTKQTTEIEFLDPATPNDRCRRFPRLPGLFMAVFLALGLLLASINPALLQSPATSLVDGSWTAAYQDRFDQGSLLFDPATTAWGVLEYALFRQGRTGLLVGEEGWLYSTEEFTFPDDPAIASRNLQANLDDIAAVEERLEGRGARLVVVLLPAKARLYPERLGRYRLPDGPEERFELALAGLRERGVNVVDLLPPLRSAKVSSPVFLRTDTHWTPYGARVAARSVAEAVAELGSHDWLGEEEYSTSRSDPRPYRGDLASFLPLGPFYDELGPPDDMLPRLETNSRSPAGNDLFAEVEIPVVLVGTSYSQDDRWNFAGWLREALGSDVLVAAQRGQGPFEPMIEYLQGEAFDSAPPQVVVWEVPERYLSDRWQAGEGENE